MIARYIHIISRLTTVFVRFMIGLFELCAAEIFISAAYFILLTVSPLQGCFIVRKWLPLMNLLPCSGLCLKKEGVAYGKKADRQAAAFC